MGVEIRATFGNVNLLTLIIWTAETLTVHEARSLDIACTFEILTEGMSECVHVCVFECERTRENHRQKAEGHFVFQCESASKRVHLVV